ncbi:hypothetical protein [Alteromonas sp. a30]|uniref:hypothetical protein n=1 Tax=Alteromonas sp. a30 TaxID=2730917 RepID=UPI00227FC692|nr:hypothetical protein [Alteromonas sp. a30]MCY7294289.1 hypothetical protein [Alteromonas sp. a30]
MDLAIAFVISNIWTIGFLIAAVYNQSFRPEHKPITHFALFAAVIFALAHLAFSQWIAFLHEPIKIHYLYLAFSALVLAVTPLIYNRIRGFVFHWQLKLAMGLLVFDLILTFLVHIDRNVIALNTGVGVNYERGSAWWLWDVRTILSHLFNTIIFVSLFLPVGLFTKNKSTEEADINFNGEYANIDNVIPMPQTPSSNLVKLSIGNGFRTLSTEAYLKEVDQAYNRVEAIQDLIHAMPEGDKKITASQFVFTASELITEQDHSKTDYIQSINLLCDKARDLALYSYPPGEKRNVELTSRLEQHI